MKSPRDQNFCICVKDPNMVSFPISLHHGSPKESKNQKKKTFFTITLIKSLDLVNENTLVFNNSIEHLDKLLWRQSKFVEIPNTKQTSNSLRNLKISNKRCNTFGSNVSKLWIIIAIFTA
jgi:hypothetical protein